MAAHADAGRLFGFTGATLTTGAVAGTCTRCDGASIGPYLVMLTS